jgi:hypothetical protein
MKTPLKKHEQLASKSERTKNTDEEKGRQSEQRPAATSFFLSITEERKRKKPRGQRRTRAASKQSMGVTEAAGQRHDKGTKASEHGARLVPSSTSPAAGNLFAWLWLPKMLPNRVSREPLGAAK